MTELDGLLDFAERSRLPEGGFGYLGADGQVLAGRPVETWIVAPDDARLRAGRTCWAGRAPASCCATASRR